MRIIPPFASKDDEGYAFLWSHNPNSIDRGTSITFYVEGGVSPYSWILTTGTSFSVFATPTNDQYTRIYAVAAATSGDEDEVTVTDAEGNTVVGYIKCCSPTPCCNENDTNVVLLLPSNTTNGSTTFVDSGLGASCPHTINVGAGDPQHSTTQKKIGSSSVWFDGNDYLQLVDHADWDFGTGDFCVDFLIYTAQNAGTVEILGRHTAGLSTWSIGMISGKPYFYSVAQGAALIATSNVADSAWRHVAFTRVSGRLRCFIVGDEEFDYAFVHDLTTDLPLSIGWTGRNLYFNGYLDQIRVSKGNGRWSEDFFAPDWVYLLNTPGYAFSWDQGNTYGMVGQWLSLSVTGGCPPYFWSVDNSDFEFLAPWTNGLNNRIRSNEEGAVGTVTVTDACGSVVGEASTSGVFSDSTSDIITVSFDETGEDWWDEEDLEAFCGGGSYDPLANTGDDYGPFSAGSYIKVEWEGGVPPYDMEIKNANFFLDVTRSQTTGRTGDPEQIIFSNTNACGSVRLLITDACGNSISVIAKTNDGHWVWVGLCQPGGGCAPTIQQGPFEYAGLLWYGYCCEYDSGLSNVCCRDAGDGTSICWTYNPSAPCDPDGIDSMDTSSWQCT